MTFKLKATLIFLVTTTFDIGACQNMDESPPLPRVFMPLIVNRASSLSIRIYLEDRIKEINDFVTTTDDSDLTSLCLWTFPPTSTTVGLEEILPCTLITKQTAPLIKLKLNELTPINTAFSTFADHLNSLRMATSFIDRMNLPNSTLVECYLLTNLNDYLENQNEMEIRLMKSAFDELTKRCSNEEINFCALNALTACDFAKNREIKVRRNLDAFFDALVNALLKTQALLYILWGAYESNSHDINVNTINENLKELIMKYTETYNLYFGTTASESQSQRGLVNLKPDYSNYLYNRGVILDELISFKQIQLSDERITMELIRNDLKTTYRILFSQYMYYNISTRSTVGSSGVFMKSQDYFPMEWADSPFNFQGRLPKKYQSSLPKPKKKSQNNSSINNYDESDLMIPVFRNVYELANFTKEIRRLSGEKETLVLFLGDLLLLDLNELFELNILIHWILTLVDIYAVNVGKDRVSNYEKILNLGVDSDKIIDGNHPLLYEYLRSKVFHNINF